MSRRALTLLALAAVGGLAAFTVPTMSGATFTATSANAISSVTASSDWTPPTVSVRTPAATVKDTVNVVADATDSGTGVSAVTLQVLPSGATAWVALCTTSTAPYTCSWNTKTAPDGVARLRAIATDGAGYTTTSDEVSTTVANNLLVVLADPGDIVRGTPVLTATLYNAGLVPYTVTIQYAVTGTTTWRNLCTGLVAPYACPWTTGTFTQGESYDLRAVATFGSSSTTSAVIDDVLVDNVAPTVTMVDPGTPLRGTATFAANAADAESSIASVQLQYQRSGTLTWTTFCTIALDPYSCRYDTTKLADGTYAFRAIATDAAGNATTSTSVTNRVVDNTVSAVSMEDPGAYLSGTVTLTASASSTAGIASVRIDRAPTGTTTWTTVCTDTAAPYTCAFDTTAVADGGYDLRAVMTDGLGRTTTSATLVNRIVDNSPLKAYDVQTVNGGARSGRLDAGDQLRLTYTDQVNPTSISAGWNGTALAVTLRLRDGVILGAGGSNDTVDVLRGGAAVNLGSVNLKANFIKNNKTAQFNATMVGSTTTVNGVTATVVTITLGSLSSGGSLRSVTSNVAMLWTPSIAALDLDGRAASAASATERGALDRDF